MSGESLLSISKAGNGNIFKCTAYCCDGFMLVVNRQKHTDRPCILFFLYQDVMSLILLKNKIENGFSMKKCCVNEKFCILSL